jgi:lipopolysaccharide assembly outer membrane protein LptD (OstA)
MGGKRSRMGDRSRDPGIVKLVTITKLHDRWALPFLTLIVLTLLAFSFPGTAMAAKSDLIQKSNEPQKKKKGPEIPFPSLHRPAKGAPVNVEAEHMTYDPATEIAVATGQVRITWGPYVLDATKVTYNRRTDQFNAEGQVRIIDPGGTLGCGLCFGHDGWSYGWTFSE